MLLLNDASEKEFTLMDSILMESDTLGRLGRNGRLYYEKNLSIYNIAAKYEQLFENLNGHD